MHRGAAGDELAAVDRAVAAAKIADEAARLAHEQHARGDVPDLQVAFPETVVAPRRDPCEVEAGGAEAADTGHFGRDRAKNAAPLRHIAVAHVRNARRDQAFVEVTAGLARKSTRLNSRH